MPDHQSKFLHCRIRVHDLEKSVKFYSDVIGFRKRHESISPSGHQLVFLELPGNSTLLELCYQPNSPDFAVPEDLMHFGISCPDLDEFRRRWEPEGIEFWPAEGPVSGRFYFINDPDGYEVEILKG